jgi:hypothetical protein
MAAKQGEMKEARLWAFIEESSYRQWPQQQYLMPFVMTMDDSTILLGMVRGKPIYFDNERINKTLLIPGRDHNTPLNDLEKLSPEEISTIFNDGVKVRVKALWPVEKAKQAWSEWLIFVNMLFTFEEHPLELTNEVLHMAIVA